MFGIWVCAIVGVGFVLLWLFCFGLWLLCYLIVLVMVLCILDDLLFGQFIISFTLRL